MGGGPLGGGRAWLGLLLGFLLRLVVEAARLARWAGTGTAGGGPGRGTGKPPEVLRALALVFLEAAEARRGARALGRALVWYWERGVRLLWLYAPEDALQRDPDFLAEVRGWAAAHAAGGRGGAQVTVERAAAAGGREVLGRGRWEAAECPGSTDPGLRVLVTSHRDGGARVLDAIAGARGDGAAPSAGADSVRALENLLRTAGGPGGSAEPDLMVVVGPSLTTAGFSPWLTRVCEIHRLESIDHLTEANVGTSLDQFFRTHQRLGA